MSRTVFHVTSEREREQVLCAYPSAQTRVVPNAVEGTPAPRKHAERFRVLFLGRLHPIKGLENLIDAVALCPEQYEVIIAGRGDPAYERSLLAHARSRRVDRRVHFIGFVPSEDRARLFADVDILALPSQSENFGMVVAEALANETPVLVSRNTPWTAVENVGCGRVSDCDPVSLAASVQRLATDDLAEMGRRGAAWIAREFSPATIGLDMLRLYETVCDAQSVT